MVKIILRLVLTIMLSSLVFGIQTQSVNAFTQSTNSTATQDNSTPQEQNSSNTALSYAVFFITENDTCTDSEYKSLKFYQVIADEYLTLYKIPHDLEGSLCVPFKNYQTYFSGLSTFTLPIVIADNTVGQKLVQQGYYGLYEISGTGRQAVYVCSCDPDIESWTGAWVMSHELSHFGLHYFGEPDTISVDWVHSIQALEYDCTGGNFTKICPQYSTYVTSPSGNQIPVMEVYGQGSSDVIPVNAPKSEVSVLGSNSNSISNHNISTSSTTLQKNPAGITASSKFGTLQIDNKEYDVTYTQGTTVQVSGIVNNLNSWDNKITVIFRLPDGSTKGSQIAANNDGTFQTSLSLDSNSQKGTYAALASYSGTSIGTITFTVKQIPIQNSPLLDNTRMVQSSSSAQSNQLSIFSQFTTKVYQNKEYNLAIGYPSNWLVEENYVSGNGNVGIVKFKNSESEEATLSIWGKVTNVQSTGNQYLNKMVQDEKDFCSSFTFVRDHYTCEFNLGNATIHQYNGLTHYIIIAFQDWKASPNSNSNNYTEMYMEDDISNGNDVWKLYGSVDFNDSSSDTVNKVTDYATIIDGMMRSFNVAKNDQIASYNSEQITGLHKGEWIKYKAVYYTPKISQEMKEIANNVSKSSNLDKNLTISNVQWFKFTIKDVQNNSYVFDSTMYLKNGTEITKTNLTGNFEPQDKYMLVVPVNLQVGDTVKGMTLLHDGIVKDILLKPILGQDIDVFEIVENNKTSSDNYTAESHTDSLYDKKTGILLHSSASISFSSSGLGSSTTGYEIEAVDFSDALPSDTHIVPEFPTSLLVLLIAIASTISFYRIKPINFC